MANSSKILFKYYLFWLFLYACLEHPRNTFFMVNMVNNLTMLVHLSSPSGSSWEIIFSSVILKVCFSAPCRFECFTENFQLKKIHLKTLQRPGDLIKLNATTDAAPDTLTHPFFPTVTWPQATQHFPFLRHYTHRFLFLSTGNSLCDVFKIIVIRFDWVIWRVYPGGIIHNLGGAEGWISGPRLLSVWIFWSFPRHLRQI